MVVTFLSSSDSLLSFFFRFSLGGLVIFLICMIYLVIYLIPLGLEGVYSVYYTHIHQFDIALAILLACVRRN